MLDSLVGIIASSGGAAGGGAAYESIASATGTGSSGTITFSSIPSTYASLQIRGVNIPAGNNWFAVRFNSDTASNYAWHYLSADGSTNTVVAGSGASKNQIDCWSYQYPDATNGQPFIIDIHDYASTTKNKTLRMFTGRENNSTSSSVDIRSGLWRSTSAITSITMFLDAGNYSTNTRFALYGIKGA